MNNNDILKAIKIGETLKADYDSVLQFFIKISLEVLNAQIDKRKPIEVLNDELAEVIEDEQEGEYIWTVQNHTTGKMSTGFTKGDAIHNYNNGKVFDISEWEECNKDE